MSGNLSKGMAVSTREALAALSKRLRETMSEGKVDLETAIKRIMEESPDAGPLLSQLLQGAQDAQERTEQSAAVNEWLEKASSSPRIRHLADTLQGLEGTVSTGILGGIARRRPDLAEALRNALFQFSDLAYADTKGLQRLVTQVSRETLLLSLRGLEGTVSDRLMASMSKRVREDIVDELGWMAPVRRSKVDEARRDLVAVAKRLLESGDMFLRRPNDPDPYID